MRILFVMEHSGIGPLVPALTLLHDRGHDIHLAARRVKSGSAHEELETLAAAYPRITYVPLPGQSTRWTQLARSLRYGIDYLRYLEPCYRDAPKLRARAEARAPRAVRGLGRAASSLGPRALMTLQRSLEALERGIEPPPRHLRYLEDEAPDVVLVTPLVDLGSRQADWLRAAKRLGVRTAYPVFSWDNLTNKGLLRDVPDLVLVWNDLQEREAVELHHVPPDRVTVTGAPVCDPWFEWRPSRTREEFCREVGLRDDLPFVLYVCSSRFVAPDEVAFVRGWIERLRARGGLLADAGILVRPYPDTFRFWAEAGVEGPQVRIWPRSGEAPHDEASRQNYFDSIYHAAAVMGINTTAQIESAIVGRPVHTLLADVFRDTQQGTLHFRYLEADEFGPLIVGRDFDEHAAQLEASLRGEGGDDGRNERFVRRFVRPLGPRPARVLVVDAIERLAARPAPAPEPGPVSGPLVRAILAPFLAAGSGGTGRRSGAGEKGRQTPSAELRRTVKQLRRDRRGTSLVAGPWLDDEIGELLYWIPFLRWVQNSSIGLRDRLYVVCRASGAAWYEGIGAAHVEVLEEEPDEIGDLVETELGLGRYRVLKADAVHAARAEIAAGDPTRRIQHRLVEFAPLAVLDPPADLPGSYLAVWFGASWAPLRVALSAHATLVDVQGYDGSARTAVLAHARGFVGTYGADAYLASLVGTSAVAVDARAADPLDLRMAAGYLGRPPFGLLHLIDGEGAPRELAEQVVGLLEAESSAAVRA